MKGFEVQSRLENIFAPYKGGLKPGRLVQFARDQFLLSAGFPLSSLKTTCANIDLGQIDIRVLPMTFGAHAARGVAQIPWPRS